MIILNSKTIWSIFSVWLQEISHLTIGQMIYANVTKQEMQGKSSTIPIFINDSDGSDFDKPTASDPDVDPI